jgi:hypothetical protein
MAEKRWLYLEHKLLAGVSLRRAQQAFVAACKPALENWPFWQERQSQTQAMRCWHSGVPAMGGRHLACCIHGLMGLITCRQEAGEDARQKSSMFEAALHAIVSSCQGWPAGHRVLVMEIGACASPPGLATSLPGVMLPAHTFRSAC